MNLEEITDEFVRQCESVGINVFLNIGIDLNRTSEQETYEIVKHIPKIMKTVLQKCNDAKRREAITEALLECNVEILESLQKKNLQLEKENQAMGKLLKKHRIPMKKTTNKQCKGVYRDETKK